MLSSFLELFKTLEWPSILIGAFIGAIIPVVGKWIFSLFRTRKEKYHLSLLRGESATYRTMRDGDVSVNVKYKGEAYSGSLSIIEIGLVNDGLEDLSYVNRFDKPILIRSSAYKIVDAQYIGKSKIKATVTLLDNTVQIMWGLLKKDETIAVRLVGEYVDSSEEKRKDKVSFYDSLSFSVRSDCVDYIAPRRLSFKFLALMSFIIAVLFGTIQYLASGRKDSIAKEYTFLYNGQIVSGCLEYDEKSEVYAITPRDSVARQNMLLDFNSYPRIIVSRSWREGTFIFVMYFGFWLFMLLVCALLSLWDRKKDGKKVFEE